MFIKKVSKETSDNEAELQSIAARYGFSPKVISISKVDDACFIVMEDLQAECLADVYGEDPDNIPKWIWNEIRIMVKTLLDEEGIEYPDITPYNFIEKDNRVYMIDFGDAKYVEGENNWFVQEFIDGENYWNPDYK
jgi:tRNA A-37 threonylcarbamoyl transferase component Bud32